ncbi:MAG: hemin uptake protein HemP [Mangrovicoccus sp.]
MVKPTPPKQAINVQQDTPPIYDAQAMTEGGNTALIHLNGCIYTLRITRAGKLILTK